MYISAETQRRTGGKNDVVVWERVNGKRKTRTFPAPYYYFTKNSNGNYTSIYGEKLARHDFSSFSPFHKARQDAESSKIRLYEADIPPEIKILSEHYYNSPPPKLHITFFDIEVDYNPEIGFSSVKNPYAPINSISMFHAWKKKFVVHAVPPKNWDGNLDPTLHDLADITLHKNEKDLLLATLEEIEDSDGLCGWNSDFFDIPYMGKRIQTVLGDSHLRRLSFDEGEMPKYRDVEVQKKGYTLNHPTLDLSGRLKIDYLTLFQKYEMDGRPSYKLEAIADEVLPHLPKLQYEGSLHNLYHTNFSFFIRYNIRDTEILMGFEEKLGYVELANTMYHLSTGLFKHVLGTLKLVDLAIINYCHYELGGVRVPNWTEGVDGRIEGALVLLPQIGMHDWVGSIDINSLYPSAIRSINISPETIRGQFIEKMHAWEEIRKQTETLLTLRLENGRELTASGKEWNQLLIQKSWAISSYGTVYDQTKKGIIPSILENWYNTRKEYQALKKEAEKNGDKEKAAYYDRLQYVYKIKLNSTYGALTNYYFRFFDLRMGESVTGTGRSILTHQCRKVTELLDGEYEVNFPIYNTLEEAADEGSPNTVALQSTTFNGKFQADSVIYGDTDSVYFKTHTNNKEQAVLVADAVAKGVNDSFQQFMQTAFLCTPGFDNLIKSAREIVSSRGIFVDKKRYTLHVVDKEGKSTDSLKTMGLELKKTTLPKPIAIKLTSFIERLLKREEWKTIAADIIEYKKQLIETAVEDVTSIGLPKGVNGVEKYTQEYKTSGMGARLPGGAASAIHFNECLEKYGDKEQLPIVSGTKIKVFYLKSKCGKFTSIALPTDIEVIPKWFTEDFVPNIDKEKQLSRLVDNTLKHIFTAIGRDVPNEQDALVDSLFEF